MDLPHGGDAPRPPHLESCSLGLRCIRYGDGEHPERLSVQSTFSCAKKRIKGKIHGETVGAVFHDIRIEDLLVRAGVVFITFIPLFICFGA
jgi:hypothetical protein